MAIQPARLVNVADDGEKQIQDLGQSQAPAPSSDAITSGMTATSQVPTPTAKPSGYKTITGSNPGNHSPELHDGVTPALEAIRNAPSPREVHGQAPLSGKQAAGAAPTPTEDTTGVD